MKNKSNYFLRIALLIGMLTTGATVSVRASDETDVRGTVENVFQQLKSRDFGSVYDALPSATQTRITRERFVNAMKRAQDRYSLDRISIATIRVAGNVAVADTELFGRITNPIDAEGKIVAQQYLVRENGKWRVATGDTATIQRFLKSNPNFARKFPIRQPRVYMKQGDKWVEFRLPK